jgi:hypothetical protein
VGGRNAAMTNPISPDETNSMAARQRVGETDCPRHHLVMEWSESKSGASVKYQNKANKEVQIAAVAKRTKRPRLEFTCIN